MHKRHEYWFLGILGLIGVLSSCTPSNDGSNSAGAERRNATARFIESIPATNRSVAWIDGETIHLPVVGLSIDKVEMLQEASRELRIVIDKGDWSVEQLEKAQLTLTLKLDRLIRGTGFSTDRGRSKIVVDVSPESQQEVLLKVSQMTAEDLGGVDPAVVTLEVGQVDQGAIGRTSNS